MNLTKSCKTVSILKLVVGMVAFLLLTAISAVGHRKRKPIPVGGDLGEAAFDESEE